MQIFAPFFPAIIKGELKQSSTLCTIRFLSSFSISLIFIVVVYCAFALFVLSPLLGKENDLNQWFYLCFEN